MISDRLKEIQETIGLNNQEMADRLFISVSLLEKLRAGTRRITPALAQFAERINQEHNDRALELLRKNGFV